MEFERFINKRNAIDCTEDSPDTDQRFLDPRKNFGLTAGWRRLHTHKTFMVFSSSSRIFIFEFWDIASGAESYLRWLMVGLIGGGLGSPTSSFSERGDLLIFIDSEFDSSDEVPEVLTEIMVDCSKGRPISWKEFMLEKPLSSSVWHVENRFDLMRTFGATLPLLFATFAGKIVGSSSSLWEFEELDEEWTDDSSVLRSDECDSRLKPNKKSFRCCSMAVR